VLHRLKLDATRADAEAILRSSHRLKGGTSYNFVLRASSQSGKYALTVLVDDSLSATFKHISLSIDTGGGGFIIHKTGENLALLEH